MSTSSYRALDTTTPPNENRAAGRYSSRYVANNLKVTINFFFECHSLWIMGVPNLSLANQFFSNVRIRPNGLVFVISSHHGVEAKTAPCHAFTFTPFDVTQHAIALLNMYTGNWPIWGARYSQVNNSPNFIKTNWWTIRQIFPPPKFPSVRYY